jgi:hypothetical protein
MKGKNRRRKGKDDKYERDLQEYIAKYIEATGDTGWTTEKVAAWAIDEGLWHRYRISAIRQLAREITRAASKVYIKDQEGFYVVDEHGNRVRKYHPYRLGTAQPMFWDAMENISRENMNTSKIIRRTGIKGRIAQLITDIDYFNKHHNPGDELIVDPDFTHDIAEGKQSGEYIDAPPDENDDGGPAPAA